MPPRVVKVVPNKKPSGNENRQDSVLELFNRLEKGELTMKTETPSALIMPLVILRVIQEADNPKRTISLTEVFLNELDKRMISKDRKGRIELLEALRSAAVEENRTKDLPW